MSPGARWIAGLVALLVFNAIAMVTLAAKAGDPSARVIPDYYQKAVAWDDDAAARTASATLGWTARLSIDDGVLSAVLVDRAGAPVLGAAIEVVLHPRARADEPTHATLTEVGDGAYTVRLALARRGLHEVALTARRGDDAFLTTGVVEP